MKKFTLLFLSVFLLTVCSVTVGPEPQKVRDRFFPEGENINLEVWVQDLEVPWELVFLPDGRALVTERPGRVRLIENGRLREKPYAAPREVYAAGEGGLMGMAHHPDFPREPYIYIMYTYREGGDIFNKVVRLKDGVETGSMDKTIIDKIPGGNYHDGGRIKFGPDGKLYITTGEIYQRNLAQSLDSLGGKILRLNPDGSVPRDNPFKNSPIFSYGHRNPQGIDWHPETRDLFSSEHGPSGEMAQHAHDEVNVIRKGKNYGWPEVIGAPGRDPYVDPLVCWKETTPPAGVAFWKGDFYVTTLRSRALIRIGVDQTPDGYEVKYIHRWFARDYDEGKLGRLRNVVVGPDNALYLMSSNRDGRGDPRPGDDQIYRITFKD